MWTIDAWVAVTVDDDGHCGMGGILQTQKNETRISRPLRIVQKTESIALYRAIEAAIVSAGHMAAEQLIIHLDAPTIVAAVRDGRPPKGCARYATRIRQQAQHYAVVVTIQYDWGRRWRWRMHWHIWRYCPEVRRKNNGRLNKMKHLFFNSEIWR